ncbi:MAG TPA: hypothetical protein VLF21_02250 [Candidatus Saccharimonadales bacterium]|nr:hypothetical protein [Candidatus Saccharimonadales bacterium]
MLEGPEGNFVNYSDSPASELGKELAPLAHKADVVAGDVGNYKPSDTVSRILDRAKSLTKAGLEWHHHVTFKGCQFHQGDANFNLVFEDPKVPEPIISSSDHEPIDDLKLIEPLFYSQHSKS